MPWKRENRIALLKSSLLAFGRYNDYINGRHSGLRKGDKLSDPLVPLFTAKLHLKLAEELDDASARYEEIRKALYELHGPLTGGKACIEGRSRRHVLYRLHASRLKLLLSLDASQAVSSDFNYFGSVLELLESYNDSSYWKSQSAVSKSSISTASPSHLAPLQDSPNGIDKTFSINWVPSGEESVEERMCVVLCDCLRQLHKILDGNVYFHRARLLLAEIYLGKGLRTTAVKIAKAAHMPAKLIEVHLAPRRARGIVDYLFYSASKRQRGSNPVRVWKDDGKDRGTAYLMVRLDQGSERKYERLRARCICAVIRSIEVQEDYPGLAWILKKLRSASGSTTQLFQKLICLTIQSMGRLILRGSAHQWLLLTQSPRVHG